MTLSWKKIALVIEREFLTRVKSKLFIISTLLVPFGFAAFIGVTVAIQLWEVESNERIAVIDDTDVVLPRLLALNPEQYEGQAAKSLEQVREDVLSGELGGFIIISNEVITGERNPELVYRGKGGLSLVSGVRGDLREVIREIRLENARVSDEVRSIFESSVGLETRRLSETGEEQQDDTAALSAIGFILGLVIFIAVLSYGSILMRGVIEEKSSRIIEVIASSIRPIELLIGKILGISSVAIVQFSLWAVLIFGLSTLAGTVISLISSPQEMVTSQMERIADENGVPMQELEQVQAGTSVDAIFSLPEIPSSLVIYFFLFFILGYFTYASLFAAIGSAVDQESDSQQLMTPVMLLLMFAYIFNIQVMQNPDTTASIAVSLIPFFAPINMITRIAISDVPFWQIGTSLLLLVGTTYAILMISARVYQKGILSFGKKAGFKDLLKWIGER